MFNEGLLKGLIKIGIEKGITLSILVAPTPLSISVLWSHSWGRTPAGQQSPASAQEGGLGGFQDDARGPPRMEVPASGLTGWGAW